MAQKNLDRILKDAVKRGEIEYCNDYIAGDDEGWDEVPNKTLDAAFKHMCEYGVDVRMEEVLMLQGMGITPQNIEEFAKTGDAAHLN